MLAQNCYISYLLIPQNLKRYNINNDIEDFSMIHTILHDAIF